MSNHHHPFDDARSAADAPPPPAAGQALLRQQALPFPPPPLRENEAAFLGGMAALSLQQQSLRQESYRSSVREAPYRRPDAASVPLGGESASSAVADPEEHRHGGDDMHMRSSSGWTEVEAGGIPPSARSLHSSALLNGVMYIFGRSLHHFTSRNGFLRALIFPFEIFL
jgi:hypothetical protein